MTRLRRLTPELPQGGTGLDVVMIKPGLVEEMPLSAVLELLTRCAVEHDRITTVERLARDRLQRELPTLLRANEPLLSADEAGRRIGMSGDYVRDHGDALGISVPLDGVTRYDPAAVDALRQQRRQGD